MHLSQCDEWLHIISVQGSCDIALRWINVVWLPLCYVIWYVMSFVAFFILVYIQERQCCTKLLPYLEQ